MLFKVHMTTIRYRSHLNAKCKHGLSLYDCLFHFEFQCPSFVFPSQLTEKQTNKMHDTTPSRYTPDKINEIPQKFPCWQSDGIKIDVLSQNIK